MVKDKIVMLPVLCCLLALSGMLFGQGATNQAPVFNNSASQLSGTVRADDGTSFRVSASDPDGDPLDYTFSVIQQPSSLSVQLWTTSQSGVTQSFVDNGFSVPCPSTGDCGALLQQQIVVRVTVTDPGQLSATEDFTFTISSINHKPSIDIEVDNGSGRGTQSNPLPAGSGIVLKIQVTDPDLIKIFRFQWRATKLSGSICPGGFPTIQVFTGETSQASVFVPLLRTTGMIEVTHTLTDGIHTVTDQTVVWVAGDPNCGSTSGGGGNVEGGPTISSLAASPTSIKPGGTISLTASADNPQGESLTFRWFVNSTLLGNVFVGGKGFLFRTQTSTSSSTASFFVTPTLGERDLFFTLEVQGSSSGKLDSKGITVPVRNDGGSGSDIPPPPPPPSTPTPQVCNFSGGLTIEVDAGPEFVQVLEGTTFALDGSAFSPPPGGAAIPSSLSIAWSVVNSGGLNISVANPSVAKTSFVAPQVAADTTVSLRLTATETGSGNSCSDDTQITILESSSNRAPTVAVSANPSVALPGEPVTLSASATSDSNGDPLTFSWQPSPTNAASVQLNPLDISRRQVRFVAPTLATDADLQFTVTVGDGSLQSSAVVTVKVLGETSVSENSPNDCQAGTQALQVDAGRQIALILEGNTFALNGSAFNPNQGGSVIPGNISLQWAVINSGGLNIQIQNPTQAQTSFVAPEVDLKTEVTIRLTATSGSLSCSDEIRVRILNQEENQPPQATAVAKPAEAEVDETVILDAGASIDPDGDTLSFEWQQTAPASISVALIMENQEGSKVSFIAPSLEADTTLTFQVTVSDSEFEDTFELNVLIRADESVKTLSSLVFPFRALIAGSSTGVALLNASDKSARLSFSAVDPEGMENMIPQEEVLAPGRQLPRQAAEILGENREDVSVLRVQSNRNVEGFFSHQTVEGLDGVSRLDRAKRLYLPYAPRQVSDEFVEIFIHNPTAPPADITIKLFNTAGEPQGEVPLELPPGGSFRSTLAQLFEDVADFGAGYLRIDSPESDILAYEIFGDRGSFAALTGQKSLPKQEVIAPIFGVSEVANSEIRLINTNEPAAFFNDTNEIKLRFRIFQKTLEGLDELIYRTPQGQDEQVLKVGEMMVLDTRAFLQEKGLWEEGDGLLTGHFIIELIKTAGFFPTTNAVSAIAFQLTPGSLAALPMQDEGVAKGRLLQVAQGDFGSFFAFTGIALLNPPRDEEAEDVRAHFELFDELGSLVDEADLNLAPGEKVSLLISEIFPRFRLGEVQAQTGGHIEVTAFKGESEEELSRLVMFALFSVGNSVFDSLAAVEVLEGQ